MLRTPTPAAADSENTDSLLVLCQTRRVGKYGYWGSYVTDAIVSTLLLPVSNFLALSADQHTHAHTPGA